MFAGTNQITFLSLNYFLSFYSFYFSSFFFPFPYRPKPISKAQNKSKSPHGKKKMKKMLSPNFNILILNLILSKTKKKVIP
ncbi:uncharacterized protein J3R85_003710 [Psidium guajava]|nr:uncharacterized protein J3R85_003710 [Psidium guajava]